LEEWSSGVKIVSNDFVSISSLVAIRKGEVVNHLTRFKAEHDLEFNDFCAKVHVRALGGTSQSILQARSTVILSHSLMDETGDGGLENSVGQEVDDDEVEGHMVEG
jgi:hypothetical protein